MLIFGYPIVDWSAILKIVIAALIGGCGIVIVYGFLLLGVKYAGLGDDSGQTPTPKPPRSSATPSPQSARSSSSASSSSASTP